MPYADNSVFFFLYIFWGLYSFLDDCLRILHLFQVNMPYLRNNMRVILWSYQAQKVCKQCLEQGFFSEITPTLSKTDEISLLTYLVTHKF